MIRVHLIRSNIFQSLCHSRAETELRGRLPDGCMEIKDNYVFMLETARRHEICCIIALSHISPFFVCSPVWLSWRQSGPTVRHVSHFSCLSLLFSLKKFSKPPFPVMKNTDSIKMI